jgi:predicted acyltransferase
VELKKGVKGLSMQNEKPERLIALDVFRGLTIAGMVLVNNPGTWSNIYSPLKHASWHGCTPTDWIFPFFLFIVGVAITLSLNKRKERGDNQWQLLRQIMRRSITIFLLGLCLAGFPYFDRFGLMFIAGTALALWMTQPKWQDDPGEPINHRCDRYALLTIGLVLVAGSFYSFDTSNLRIPGVLQRIAVVYFFAAWIFLKTGIKTQATIAALLLLVYWAMMTLIPVPGIGESNLEQKTNLAAWLDNRLLGGHLWRHSVVWDPEGILSTLPAISTALLGILLGHFLRLEWSRGKQVVVMLAAGGAGIALGLLWDMWFPFNKSLWTSSYVVYTGGLAFVLFAVIFWLVDVKQWGRWWTTPFLVYGTNSITVFFLSGIMARLLGIIRVIGCTGEVVSLKTCLYDGWFTPFFTDGVNASLAWALCYVLLWLGLMWILYARKIFIKV